VHESLKPLNIIKDTVKALTDSSDLEDGISKTVIGVASGFLVKNIFFRNSSNPLKIIARIGLQTITASFAANHADKIKSTGQKLFHALLTKLINNKNRVQSREVQE
jgi:hypothetical protein